MDMCLRWRKEEDELNEHEGVKANQKPHKMHLEVTNTYLEGTGYIDTMYT